VSIYKTVKYVAQTVEPGLPGGRRDSEVCSTNGGTWNREQCGTEVICKVDNYIET
jgi:hypothetical protein